MTQSMVSVPGQNQGNEEINMSNTVVDFSYSQNNNTTLNQTQYVGG